ncbi:OmpL47-type beta-barrel domain-containing protein [Paenibacillus sp. MBLB4367]|uniref:OmpL47-type beta-barrel domain-containing protein n=1 Tax=Paenibacillus sp. MBLB4367 TaxID=3384767 RepID=UPI0039082A96
MGRYKYYAAYFFGLLLAMLIGTTAAHAAVVQQLPVSNPGFETLTATNGVYGPKDWKTWWWGAPAGNPPVAAGYSDDVRSGGLRSAYVDSVGTGYAGWVSSPIAVPADMSSFRIAVKLKASSDYAGNKPRLFVSFQNGGTFLGAYTTDQTEGLALTDWTEVSFLVDRSQFPAGTNVLVLNVTTVSTGAASASGKLYVDDVKMEASDEPFPVVQRLPVSNPDFETLSETNGVFSPKDWKTWWWNAPAGNPPITAGYSIDERSSGQRSVYVGSVSAGYAGWVSSSIAVPANMTSFQFKVKLKASSDYAGNKPRLFVSFQNGGTFLGSYTTDRTEGLSFADWTEVTFNVDQSQFPAGTNSLVLNLTTVSTGTSSSSSGRLYMDDISALASNQSLGPAAFTLKGTQFANWWKLGDAVVFRLDAGAVPSSIKTVIGSVYNSDNVLVSQVPVSRQSFLDQGWSWMPAEPGYYEIAFAYEQNGSANSTPLPVSYTYSPTDFTTFTRDRYSLVVSSGPTKPISQRWPVMGFSYQLSEGENAMKIADLIGFQFARIHAVPWGTQFRDTSWAIEPSRGVYNWSKFDDQVGKLTSYGFELAGNLLYTPQWASPHPEQTQANISVPAYSAYAPVDMQDWENFVRAVVNRYGDRMKTWEVWNEPNMPGLSVFWLDTTERFVELLSTAYRTIKEVQPESDVWIGGLAGRNYLTFYKHLLRLNGASSFDKLALHGYEADPRWFQQMDQTLDVPSKPWVDSENHAILVSSNSVNGTLPTESEIAKRMMIDFLKQLKWGTQKIAFFNMLNLSEMETLAYAKSKGNVTHSAGLFRSKPRIEPRLAAAVAHQFLDLAGQSVTYQGEYTLADGQKAVLFENDGSPLLALWTEHAADSQVDSRLAAAFSMDTTVTDWEGKTQRADSSLTVPRGKILWIRQIDVSVLEGLPGAVPFLISDFDRIVESPAVPETTGLSGQLFDPNTLEVADDAVWTADHWEYQGVLESTKPSDFDASFAAGYSDSGFDLVVRVKDGTFVQDNPLGSYWKGDSVQFAIDTFGQGYPGDQVEFQAALTPQGPVLYKQLVPYVGGNLPTNWSPGNSVVQYGSLHVAQTASNETVYYIHVDSSELYPYIPASGEPLRLSVLVNDNNGSGRLGWLEWGGGIGKTKKPAEYGKAWISTGEGELPDTAAPVTTAAVLPELPDGQNGWYVHPVTVSLTAQDDLSGVASSEYTLNGGTTWQPYTVPVTFDQDGSFTFGYRSTDHAGNSETAKTAAFRIDITAPTATVAYSGSGADAQVTAIITPSEPVTITNNGGSTSYTFLYNGSFTFEFVDTAGNTGTATAVVNSLPSASTGVPGKPVLLNDNGYDTGILDGHYNIAMNVWWGNNGRVYRLYENDVLIDTRILADRSPNSQSTVTTVTYKANGTYRYYAELSNAYGTARSDVLTVNVTQAAPANPVLYSDNWDGDGNYKVSMNLWWGTNGTTYRLYENGVLIDTQMLNGVSPQAQSAVTAIQSKPAGTYEYRCELVNYAGVTSSETTVVNVTK